MTCSKMQLPDGGRAIVCSRGRKPKRKRCEVSGCTVPHTKLCDYPVKRKKTCDMKLCSGHATSVGPDRDYCPSHRTKDPCNHVPDVGSDGELFCERCGERDFFAE